MAFAGALIEDRMPEALVAPATLIAIIGLIITAQMGAANGSG